MPHFGVQQVVGYHGIEHASFRVIESKRRRQIAETAGDIVLDCEERYAIKMQKTKKKVAFVEFTACGLAMCGRRTRVLCAVLCD